uniref:integrin alpha-4-like isoform X5 n=1 Tax=Oncorhynchus gorbuscha TaxID=8017 RepID=UPI001EAE957A|nr:integrin alpha-4-like isoform X5 [Oncorhynchus gorbuscha]
MTTYGLGLHSIGLNVFFCFLLRHADLYNLDIPHAIPLSGPNGTFFGYSVLLHKHQQQTWVIVGAPVANSRFNQAVRNPGAIYKCKITDKKDCEQIQLGIMLDMPCGRHCSAEIENQWLGVSLSRRQQDGLVLACGHRWKNVYFTKKEDLNKLPHGICYKLESDLNQSSPLIPCYRDHENTFGNDFASCQAGISNVLIGDLIVMGAPGTLFWTGSVFVHNISSQVTSAYLDDNVVLYGSYLGYSVGAGHFLHPNSTEVVGGAPQYGQTGRVRVNTASLSNPSTEIQGYTQAYIFSIESSTLSIISEVKGQQLGSYFGATVCAVDLNTDGLSDLLVGAPMFSAVREEGRVYIYMNQGQANMKEMEFTLAGRDSYAARFGESITSLGDIDDDGYPDVAVGAPQEDDLHGAIYIYNGRKTGLEQYFSQRIAGSALGSAFKMFGQSVSGGIDVDGNGYPDVAVGAFLSDSAVVLRTRAVVVVEAMILLPPSVNRTHALCTENGQPAVCLKTSVCFQLHAKRVSGLIEILYNLTADVKHIEGLQSRFFFNTNGTELSNATAGSIKTRHGHMTCVTHLALLRRDIRDIFTPIHFELQYELGEHNVVRGNSKSFPPLRPMLQRGEEYSNLLTNKEEKYVSCKIAEEEKTSVGLDCSVGNLFFNTLAKVNISFLLDVSADSEPGDLNIIINATRENLENEDLLHDNIVNLTLLLRYGVNLNIHGFVSRTEFVFGDFEEPHCSAERFKYTFKVVNVGPSISHGTRVEIDIPKALAPYPYRLLNILDIQSSAGWCYIRNSTDGTSSTHGTMYGSQRASTIDSVWLNVTTITDSYWTNRSSTTHPYWTNISSTTDTNWTSISYWANVRNWTTVIEDECDLPDSNPLNDFFFFFSKSSRRHMYCMKEDALCLYAVCELGDMGIGKDVTIEMEVEMNSGVLDISPGRHSVMLLETTAVISPKKDPFIWFLKEDPITVVVLEAHHSHKLKRVIELSIIVASLLLGLFILALVVICMWKSGFFKREDKMENIQRLSWDY